MHTCHYRNESPDLSTRARAGYNLLIPAADRYRTKCRGGAIKSNHEIAGVSPNLNTRPGAHYAPAAPERSSLPIALRNQVRFGWNYRVINAIGASITAVDRRGRPKKRTRERELPQITNLECIRAQCTVDNPIIVSGHVRVGAGSRAIGPSNRCARASSLPGRADSRKTPGNR